MTTTNFEKQWEEAAKQARLEGEFYANFTINHPNVKIVRIHDSTIFESSKDYQLFIDEYEKFLIERRRR